MRGVERTGGVKAGDIIEIKKADFSRVGNCWMRGRLKKGDLAIAIQQSGDCFWTYALLKHDSVDIRNRPLYQIIPEARFGAYVLGTPYPYQPTEREGHLLLAGEMIPLSAQVDAGTKFLVASWLAAQT
jgi:hypothetical protein